MSKFRAGDRVRVRKPANVMQGPWWAPEMDLFDGSLHRIRELVADGGYFKLVGAGDYQFHPDWLEKVDPVEPVEPIRSWVPPGYSVIEIAVPDAMASKIGEGNALVWRKPVIGERFFGEEGTETSKRDYAHYSFPVIVPTTPPAPQYREPTAADVGRMVEVRDREKEPWQDRELLAVIGDETIVRRFVCRDFTCGFFWFSWTFARIKIEEVK